jgi:hypothetical protein
MRALAAALAVLFLAGCSGGGDARALQPPSPAVKQATVRQYASVIAQHGVPVQETSAEQRSCLPGDRSDFGCGARWLTLAFQVQTLSIRMRIVTDPSREEWLGEPPAEIADLVDRTMSAVLDAGAVGEDYVNAVGKCSDAACAPHDLALMDAVRRLTSELDAWQPYL